MTEVILAPDAEQLVCDWLQPELAARGRDVPVGTRVPNPRPAEFVRVVQSGGDRLNIVQVRPTLLVEGWASTESAARSLTELARGLIRSMPGQQIAGVMVYRVDELGGPSNLPDPDSAQARYTLTLSLLVRATAL